LKISRLESSLRVPCYSWEGEDVLAHKIMTDLIGLQKARFVDIGAHHPIRYSNTYLFYKHGWRGMNIDAMPGSMRLFEEVRPEDINLEVGVAATAGDHTFYMFENSALNGILSREVVELHVGRGEKLLGSQTIRCERINDLLDRHMPADGFHLLNLDIEGHDLEVLRDLDFSRWRPKMIITEILGGLTIEQAYASEETKFLRSVGYALFSRLHLSNIFVDIHAIPGALL